MTRLTKSAPLAMVFNQMTTKIALGAVVTRVPAVTELDQDPLTVIETGDWVKVDGDRGVVEITKRRTDHLATMCATSFSHSAQKSSISSVSGTRGPLKRKVTGRLNQLERNGIEKPRRNAGRQTARGSEIPSVRLQASPVCSVLLLTWKSARAADLFSDYAAKRRLERLSGTPDVISQHIVDQALIVAAAGSLHLIAEPFDHIVVQTNSDSGFSFGNGHHRSALGL